MNKIFIILQGFKHIWFMPEEAAQIITACEERVLASHIITAPFSMAEIQGGIHKDHLVEDNYLAPNEMSPLSNSSKWPELTRIVSKPFASALNPGQY